jgi:hypothetical protein
MRKLKWYYWLGFDFIISLLSTFGLVVDDEIELRLKGYLLAFIAFMIVYATLAMIVFYLNILLSKPRIKKENSRFTDILSSLDNNPDFTITKRESDLIHFQFDDLYCAAFLDFRGLNIGIFMDFDLENNLISKKRLKQLEKNYKDFFFAQHMIQSSFKKWKDLSVIPQFKNKLSDLREVLNNENLQIVNKGFIDSYLATIDKKN